MHCMLKKIPPPPNRIAYLIDLQSHKHYITCQVLPKNLNKDECKTKC